ncbi:MAG: hypothetical protein WC518_03780 [Patescibacteria group bacterium]
MKKILIKKIVIAIVLLVVMSLFCLPAVSLASTGMLDKLNTVKENSGLGGDASENALPIAVGRIIGVALGILGVIFIMLIIYAGFIWMIASGDDGKVKKAKDIIIAATIGLVIVLASYSISYFIVDQLNRASTGTGTP